MHIQSRKVVRGILIFGAMANLMLAGCATHIAPSAQQNPPPSEPLASFSHFQLMPMDASAEARKESGALATIESNLQTIINSQVAPWEKADPAGRTLRIEPFVKDLKFVSGG